MIRVPSHSGALTFTVGKLSTQRTNVNSIHDSPAQLNSESIYSARRRVPAIKTNSDPMYKCRFHNSLIDHSSCTERRRPLSHKPETRMRSGFESCSEMNRLFRQKSRHSDGRSCITEYQGDIGALAMTPAVINPVSSEYWLSFDVIRNALSGLCYDCRLRR